QLRKMARHPISSQPWAHGPAELLADNRANNVLNAHCGYPPADTNWLPLHGGAELLRDLLSHSGAAPACYQTTKPVWSATPNHARGMAWSPPTSLGPSWTPWWIQSARCCVVELSWPATDATKLRCATPSALCASEDARTEATRPGFTSGRDFKSWHRNWHRTVKDKPVRSGTYGPNVSRKSPCFRIFQYA